MSEKWILNDKFNVKKDVFRNGGTATVYKAIDIDNGKPVAIKLFNNGSIQQELTLEAYQRDLKSLQELNGHPHIAHLIDFGKDESSGFQFIVMEWLETSLLEEVNGHELTCWDNFYTHYGKPILEALSFSHKRDIVHRDIKPANILFSEDGKLKLVDFGISKYKAYWGANVTFLGWNSKPYSPPENDNYQYVNTRDIYGFAALALACLERRELKETENLKELIKNHSLEDGVSEILERCLSFNPEDRIQSIEELIDCLDRFCSSSQRVGLGYADACYLAVTATAIQNLQLSIGKADRSSIERHISRELNEACSLERQGDSKYQFHSVEHSYIVAVDEITKSHFVILAALRRESWVLENIRGKNYIPQSNFLIGKPPKSDIVLNSTISFLNKFSEYEASYEERRKQYQEQTLIDTWKSLLRLQLDLEKIAQDEVSYTKFNVEGKALVFYIENGDWDSLIGQERIIWREDRSTVSIYIQSVSNDKIYTSPEFIDVENLPVKGKLILDTRLQATSRKRQEAALDDILFDRAYRSDLKLLLFNPSRSRVPQNFKVEKFFQDDLDQSKREIVEAVLGMDDILVVNGPPGTGKTKVIAEIVLQYLASNPESKILISSQTHNAIDNALERIRQLKNDDNNLGAVRIGRRDDPRISESMKDLLLEGLVATWLEKVESRASDFLDAWSKEMAVDKSEVELGLAVRALRMALIEYEKIVADREFLQNSIGTLELSITEMQSREKVPNELSVIIFNRDKLLDNLRDMDEKIVRARRQFREKQKHLDETFPNATELSSSSSDELQEWESAFLSGSVVKEKCKKVIELLQDWFDRFGRSSDFSAAFLSEAVIVSATCIGVGLKSYKNIKFDLCIVDEASKATPTETFLPMVKAKKWVLIGDPVQLPPFVQEGARNSNLLSKHNLKESDLKATLLDRFIEQLPEGCIKNLDIQYRMCPEIGELISQIFYDKKLKTGRGASVGFDKLFAITKPVTWYSTSSEKNRCEHPDGRSFINRFEAHYISILLKRFNLAARALGKRFSVCVLSFYSSQESVLRAEVAKIGSDRDSLDINCATVDAFQGREADICIISITRSNPTGSMGFVDDFNRINVALSRGKEALVIVGDSTFCVNSGMNNPLLNVIEYINSNSESCALVSV